jgi:hypothetical protein
VAVGRRVEGAGIDGFYAHAECSIRILAARAGGLESNVRRAFAAPLRGATFFSVSHSQHSATLHAGLLSFSPSGGMEPRESQVPKAGPRAPGYEVVP